MEDKKHGSISVHTDNKMKLTFPNNVSIIIDGPLLSSVYSPEELFSIFQQQVDCTYHTKCTKIVSKDLGCVLYQYLLRV